MLTIRKYLTIVHNFFAPKISYVVGLCRRHAKLYPFKAVKTEGDDETGDEGFCYFQIDNRFHFIIVAFVLMYVCMYVAADSLKNMKRESVSSMSFERAAWTGKLNHSEYVALASWYGGMLLIMFYGIALSRTVVPDYLGLLIWVLVLVVK